MDTLGYYEFVQCRWFLVPEEHVIEKFEMAYAKKAEKYPFLEVLNHFITESYQTLSSILYSGSTRWFQVSCPD